MKVIILILITFSIINAELSRSENSVRDSETNLQWQDNSAVGDRQRNLMNSIEYCEKLTLDEKSDWRLPNKNELLSIVDYSRDSPSIDDTVFKHTSYDINYWSSTAYANRTDYAWNVLFAHGNLYYSDSASYNLYVRCVRGGQSAYQFINPSTVMYLLN